MNNSEQKEADDNYKEFLYGQDFNPSATFADYQKVLEEENEKENKNTNSVLLEVGKLVSDEYLNAINDFLKDEENGIWGNLKIVDKPIGEWQDEFQDEDDETYYWNILKGMYVNQSCGYSGDDYNGTLEVKITDNLFLRCSFSL